MATFDGLVLRRCLSDRDETLHAGFYWHELAYRINGMSVSCLRTEDTLEQSIFFGLISGDARFGCIMKQGSLRPQSVGAARISDITQLLYEFPWR